MLPDSPSDDIPVKRVCCRKHVDEDEQVRLGAHKPLPTLLQQSAGPIASQVVTSLGGIANSFWVSKSIGAEGLTAMGVVSLLEAVNNAFAQYMSTCVAARISYLFGQKRNDECAQVFVDIIRISWIFSTCLPFIIIPSVKPMSKWFGASESIQDLGLQFMIPMVGLTFLFEMYLVCCGLLQACGLSWIYGVVQTVSLVLNMCLFDPLFLLGFHMPIWGASLAWIISVTIPLIFLLILIFRGKFEVKPTLSMFCKKFSPEASHALRVGFSTLIENLSANLPDIIIQKYLGESANAIGQYNEILSVWNVLLRLFYFIVCVCIGLVQGLLPSASYAFGANRLRRVRNLAFHTFWIGTVWLTIIEAVVLPNSALVASIWLNEEKFKDWARLLFPNSMYTMILYMFRYTSVTVLQAVGEILPATILSILILLIPIPVFSTIMFFACDKDPVKLVQAFLWNDIWGAVICILMSLWKLRFLWNPAPTDDGIIEDLTNVGDEEEEMPAGEGDAYEAAKEAITYDVIP